LLELLDFEDEVEGFDEEGLDDRVDEDDDRDDGREALGVERLDEPLGARTEPELDEVFLGLVTAELRDEELDEELPDDERAESREVDVLVAVVPRSRVTTREPPMLSITRRGTGADRQSPRDELAGSSGFVDLLTVPERSDSLEPLDDSRPTTVVPFHESGTAGRATARDRESAPESRGTTVEPRQDSEPGVL